MNQLSDRLQLLVKIGPIKDEKQDIWENQWFSLLNLNRKPYVKTMVFETRHRSITIVPIFTDIWSLSDNRFIVSIANCLQNRFQAFKTRVEHFNPGE